jgi:hypothetical protein
VQHLPVGADAVVAPAFRGNAMAYNESMTAFKAFKAVQLTPRLLAATITEAIDACKAAGIISTA